MLKVVEVTNSVERTLFRTHVLAEAIRFYFSLRSRKNVVVLDKLNEIVEIQLGEAA